MAVADACFNRRVRQLLIERDTILDEPSIKDLLGPDVPGKWKTLDSTELWGYFDFIREYECRENLLSGI